MHLSISHATRYKYDGLVRLGPHLVYLRPQQDATVEVKRFRCFISPAPRVQWMLDDFDNIAASLSFVDPTSDLGVRSECEVVTSNSNAFDFLVRDYAASFPFEYEPLHRFNLGIYLEPLDAQAQASLNSWLEMYFRSRPSETVAYVFELNRCVHQNLCYRRRDEEGIQSPLETARLGSGSCRDIAVFLIECARTLGVAARFVSGYLFEPAVGAGGGDMHAWAEVFLPGAGWLGLDPTLGTFCEGAHVRVAHAVVAESVNPIQGSFHSVTAATSAISLDVRVTRLG